jgi:hypothetical protein
MFMPVGQFGVGVNQPLIEFVKAVHMIEPHRTYVEEYLGRLGCVDAGQIATFSIAAALMLGIKWP